jgi:ATP-dependent protease ClpP protease subunit
LNYSFAFSCKASAIETPGGSGEAAEEIVEFLYSKYNTVDFIISGEAKSAGTLHDLLCSEHRRA